MAKSKIDSAKNIQHTTMRGNDDVITSSLNDEVAANAEMVTVVVTLADTLEDFGALTGDAFDNLLKELRHIPESQRELVSMQERAFGQLIEVSALLTKIADEEKDPAVKKNLKDAIAAMTQRADRIKGNFDTKPQSLKEGLAARYLGLRPQAVREKGVVGAYIGTARSKIKDAFSKRPSASDLVDKKVKEGKNAPDEPDKSVRHAKADPARQERKLGGSRDESRFFTVKGSDGASRKEKTSENTHILEKIYREVAAIGKVLGSSPKSGASPAPRYIPKAKPTLDKDFEQPKSEEPPITRAGLDTSKKPKPLWIYRKGNASGDAVPDEKGAIAARAKAKGALPTTLGGSTPFVPKDVHPTDRPTTTDDSGDQSSGGGGGGGTSFIAAPGVGGLIKKIGGGAIRAAKAAGGFIKRGAMGAGRILAGGTRSAAGAGVRAAGAGVRAVGAGVNVAGKAISALNPVTKVVAAAVAGFAIGEGINKLMGQQSATKTIKELKEARQIKVDSEKNIKENEARTSSKLQQNMAKDGFTGTEAEYADWQKTPEGEEARYNRMESEGTPMPQHLKDKHREIQASIEAGAVPLISEASVEPTSRRAGTSNAVESAKEKEDRKLEEQKSSVAQAPTVINNTTNNNTTGGGNSSDNFLPAVRPVDNAFVRFQDKRSSRIM